MRRCRPHQGWTTRAFRAARATSALLIVSSVLAACGELLPRIEAGAPGSILEAGEEYVLVRATDELGVEQVRMYAIERPPTPREVAGR